MDTLKTVLSSRSTRPGLAADSTSVVISRLGKYRRIRMLRGGLVQICSNKPAVNVVCVPA